MSEHESPEPTFAERMEALAAANARWDTEWLRSLTLEKAAEITERLLEMGEELRKAQGFPPRLPNPPPALPKEFLRRVRSKDADDS